MRGKKSKRALKYVWCAWGGSIKFPFSLVTPRCAFNEWNSPPTAFLGNSSGVFLRLRRRHARQLPRILVFRSRLFLVPLPRHSLHSLFLLFSQPVLCHTESRSQLYSEMTLGQVATSMDTLKGHNMDVAAQSKNNRSVFIYLLPFFLWFLWKYKLGLTQLVQSRPVIALAEKKCDRTMRNQVHILHCVSSNNLFFFNSYHYLYKKNICFQFYIYSR